MFNVCAACGEYRADKHIEPEGPYAVCPVCGYRQPFVMLPLLIVSGPSGAGKSVICRLLPALLPEAVVLEGDILWRPEFATPEDGNRGFYETWLRLAKNIGQSGRPVVLFSAGGIPANIEPCIERRYFSQVRYLALVCAETELAERLRARPAWRKTHDDAFVDGQAQFSRWLREVGHTGEPPIDLLDTTAATPEQSARQVAEWARARLGGTDG